VREALKAAAEAPPECEGAHQGWVLVALQNAFFELLHAPTLEEGVVATVRRGGDADTNGAIAGALLGAIHGRAAVPLQWRSMVLSCRPHPLRARHPRPMPCWPVDVTELAECLLIAGRPPARE
jgi:ADP-ribosylglycohydrolase